MYDFNRIEATVEALWNQNNDKIEESVSYDPNKPLFSFLEGPPTANAPPALHHMEARVFKDLFCRYKFMKGFSVPRKAGWDTHGLPVEVQVEKKLGLQNKKDVLNYGIEKFNDACRSDVFSFIGDWEKFTKKMGYWVDLKNPYITYSNDYIESVWWSLKELYNKKLLYEGHKVVPYCTRCETALSSHEVAQGYQEIKEDTVTVMFKEKNGERYFLGWTTTPWTLPSNLALAISPNLSYVEIEHEGKRYIVAKKRAAHYFGEDPKLIQVMSGKVLIGIEYEPLFDYFKGKLNKPAFKTLSADFVTDDDGTGIVHIAPAFGEVDYDLIKKNDYAFVQPISKNGLFTKDVPELEGQHVLHTNKKVTDMLDARGLLFKKEQYTHDYPFCWRCKEPLIYYAMNSWFVKVSEHRKKLTETNQKINWYPEYFKEGRFGNWIAEAKDWALSRSKFWGTPLPIWRCACGNEIAIGSIDELKTLAENCPDNIDLHKPHIDKLTIRCKCGKEMKRVPEVIDCWYDSGSAPFAQLHYPFENKEYFEKRFPYDFIAEAVDQTRGWFYTLLVLGVLLFDKPAYTNVVCAGLLVDDKGEKMSKSKGNIINPWDIFNKYGVDAARLFMCTTAVDSTKRVGFKSIEERVYPFLNTLWNSYGYCDQFLKSCKKINDKPEKLNQEDVWLQSRLNSLITTVEDNLELHNYNICFGALEDFVINDFSRWYIKIIKDRTSEQDTELWFTMTDTLLSLSRTLAPFAPYISDYIFNEIIGEGNSVHFSGWPEIQADKIDVTLEKQMDMIKNIVEASNAHRIENKIKLKYPLNNMIVSGGEEVYKAVEKLEPVLKKMANVKKITYSDISIKWEVKPNFASVGKKYGKDVKRLSDILKIVDASNLKKELDETGKIMLENFVLNSEDLIFKELSTEDVGKQFTGGRVKLDTNITSELKDEWLYKELIRAVQDKRKKMGLSMKDGIHLYLPEMGAYRIYEKDIEKITGSKLHFGDLRGDIEEFEFEDTKHKFGVLLP